MPPPRLLELDDDVLRTILSHIPDCDHYKYAQLCTRTRGFVDAHRHGVTLALSTCRPNKQALMNAFGLRPNEIPCDGERVGAARVFNLRICLPQILEAHGGWAGLARLRARAVAAAALAAQRRAAAARHAEERRTTLQAWVWRIFRIGTLAEFETVVRDHRLDPPFLYSAYLEGALPAYATIDDVKDQITLLMLQVTRRREVRAALQQVDIRASQVDRQLWSEYEKGWLPLETGLGVVNQMMGQEWNRHFYKRGLQLLS